MSTVSLENKTILVTGAAGFEAVKYSVSMGMKPSR